MKSCYIQLSVNNWACNLYTVGYTLNFSLFICLLSCVKMAASHDWLDQSLQLNVPLVDVDKVNWLINSFLIKTLDKVYWLSSCRKLGKQNKTKQNYADYWQSLLALKIPFNILINLHFYFYWCFNRFVV